MLFLKAKKLMFLDGFVNKSIALSVWLTWSCVFGQEKVQLILTNGSPVNGEFIGTYMNHIHLLISEKLVYYSCDQVLSIKNDAMLETETLVIPHPMISFRKFVLIPFVEIASGFNIPHTNLKINDLLDNCLDDSEVNRYQMNSQA